MAAFSSRGLPRTLTLRNGASVTIRPLEPGDAERLYEFFAALPPGDRHFMKDEVLDRQTLQRWAANEDRFRSFALVAVDNGRIVADAALIRHRGPARQHQAEVRINILPELQGNGLGTTLTRELAETAWEADIEILEFNLVEGAQENAIDAVRGIGAYHVATLNDYLRDVNGDACNLAYYRLPLSAWFRF